MFTEIAPHQCAEIVTPTEMESAAAAETEGLAGTTVPITKMLVEGSAETDPEIVKEKLTDWQKHFMKKQK